MLRPDYFVADLGELATLITSDLVEGCNVWVDTDGAYWTLEKDSGAAPGPTVLTPLPGAPTAGAANARWLRNVGGGGGGGVTGDPNSILFENPTGTNAITDPKLVAAPVDQFGRPQIRDWRTGANVFPDDGPVYRQGAWQTDGDPTNQNSQGIVLYGPNGAGVGPIAGAGGYARIKPRRFGLAEIIPGVNGGNLFYAFRVDTGDSVNGLELTDDNAVQQFHIDRATGAVIMGNPTNALAAPFGATLYMNQLGAAGGSGAPVQLSEVGKAIAIRLGQYGNPPLAPGFTSNIGFFRSRAITIDGPLAPGAGCIDGDSLMNITATGVTGNGLLVPIAAVFDCVIPVGGTFATALSPNFRFQLARELTNSRRVVWSMIGLSGDLVMGAPSTLAPAPTQCARILIHEGTVATPNAMQGVATLDAGGSFVVPNTLITANTRIQLTWQDGGAAPTGTPFPRGRTPGVNFTIASTVGAADAGCDVFWQLWEPAP